MIDCFGNSEWFTKSGCTPTLFTCGSRFWATKNGRAACAQGANVVAPEVVRRVWDELEPELAEMGFELIEVEFGQHGRSQLLRLFIDREGGVTIDDCAKASRQVSAYLDKDDYIGSQYTLEVSSPGIARPLRKPEDFERFAGERIKVRSVTPVEGRSRFAGELMGYSDGMMTVKVDGTEYRIHLENVKRANLDR